MEWIKHMSLKKSLFTMAFVEKKKAEQEAVEQKKKGEKERQEFYDRVQKLMEISPNAAEAYIKAQTRF